MDYFRLFAVDLSGLNNPSDQKIVVVVMMVLVLVENDRSSSNWKLRDRKQVHKSVEELEQTNETIIHDENLSCKNRIYMEQQLARNDMDWHRCVLSRVGMRMHMFQ